MTALKKEDTILQDPSEFRTPAPADYTDELTTEFYNTIDEELAKDNIKPEEFTVVDGPAW